MLRVVLSAVDPHLVDAWSQVAGGYEFVEVSQGSILDADVDAVVSPANSFGFMDGGIDAVYLDHFGSGIQDAVRRTILERRGGELLVGDALIVDTGDDAIPYLIAAPTMRVPMRLGETVNPYLAARAVFRLITTDAAHVRSVAIPGLGTGTGGVPPLVCARQVRQAIDDVLLGGYALPQSWAEASERHQLLYTNRPRRLQS